ncbi:MAG: hypothetical protein IJ996_01465 [Clostridia bacterium]|nr:hypothetical protein [Clostridia bacterium]
MERKSKACWNCLRYKAFYVKETCRFERAGCGFCVWKKGIMKNTDACLFWTADDGKRRIRKKVCMKKVQEWTERIMEVQQILQDDEERGE